MKIAIIGTHGVGKTNLASLLFAYASKKRKDSLLIQDLNRECPFNITKDHAISAATWLVTKKISLEVEAISRLYEIIVCDRSALDPLMYIYARSGQNLDEHTQNLSDLAHHWLSTYDNIIYIRPDDQIDDFQKAVDIEFSISIKEFIEQFPSKQVYYIHSSMALTDNLDEFFQNILEC